MWVQILRLLPTLLPIIKKLLTGLSDIKQKQKNVQMSDELVNQIVAEAEKEIEQRVEETLEKYKPEFDNASQGKLWEERQEKLDELEAKLLQDQAEYREKFGK